MPPSGKEKNNAQEIVAENNFMAGQGLPPIRGWGWPK